MAYNVREPRSPTEPVGPPIVILHGMMGSKQNWNSVSVMIRNGLDHSRKIFILDARNHGQSPWDDEHNHQIMVQDVLVTLKALGLEKPVLLGHSMGGRIMMMFALRYPTLLTSLVVVEMSYHTFAERQTVIIGIARLMSQVTFEDVGGSLPKARQKADAVLARDIKNQYTRSYMLSNLYKDRDGQIKWRINLEVIARSQPQDFPTEFFKFRFPGPCLFLGGDKSNFIKASDLPVLRNMFPKAELVILEGGGHLVHVDRPREFVAVVTNFLNRTLRQA